MSRNPWNDGNTAEVHTVFIYNTGVYFTITKVNSL